MNYNNEIDNLGKFSGLSKTDLIIIIFSCLLIVVGAWNLINFEDHLESIENLKAIAKINRITDNPQRRISGTLAWGQVKNKDEIYRGDEILTDENSKAEVEFLNNTKLTIPENSLVKIDVDDDTFNIDVIKGIVDLDVKKANQKIVLKTKTKEYVINTKQKTKLSIQSNGDDLDIKSKKGSINLTKKVLKKVKIKAKAVTGPTDTKSKLVLPQKLDIFEPVNAKTYSPNKTQSFNIKLNSLKSLKDVKATITGDNFKKEIKISRVSTPVPLPEPGDYKLNVEALGDKDKPLSKSVNFSVENYSAPEFNIDTFPYEITLKNNEKINIDWSGLNTLEYILELKGDKKTNKIKAKSSQISLTPKRPGKYLVRVKVNEESAPWSKYQEMNVSFDKVMKVASAENPNLFELHKTGPIVTLNFSNISGEPATVKIYKDQEEKKLVFSKTVKGEKVTWKPKYVGDYYWKVQSGDPKKDSAFEVQSTELQKITIRNIVAKVTNPGPEKRIVNTKNPKVQLSWKKSYRNDRYFLKIFSKSGKLLATKRVKGSAANITFPSTGDFLWSLHPRKFEEYFDETDQFPLTLSLPEKPMTPEVPSKQIIRYKGIQKREAYRIKFEPMDGAKRYEIEIYDDANLQNKLVTAKSRKNFVYWVSKREGKFYFRMRYEDKWGRKSDFSNIGQIVFPISPLVK
ncbi:MAG: FecR domain-containing protein [Bdellovibrionota bacterium]|nr:FecR domain-containing protein [Bdellovibrionota bacterium]